MTSGDELRQLHVGLIGGGKLGFPFAVACAYRGIKVSIYEKDPVKRTLDFPHTEDGYNGITFDQMVAHARERELITFVESVEDLVKNEFISLTFCAVQTPHSPEYSGVTIAPQETKDFDYTHLAQAMDEYRDAIDNLDDMDKPLTLAVISTCLPGTLRGMWSLAQMPSDVSLIYNPFFIAMGTVVKDVYEPEFVIVGTLDDQKNYDVMAFYDRLHRVPGAEGAEFAGPEIMLMPIEAAELVKVGYNTFISLKIVWVNHLMEIAHRIGVNVNHVIQALKQATDRLISTKYLTPGMGDGGGCHPRDLIAMSDLERRLQVSTPLLTNLVRARESQAGWIASMAAQYAMYRELPVRIVGYTFKPESSLTDGSSALLVQSMLETNHARACGIAVERWDPDLDGPFPEVWTRTPGVFVIGCKKRACLRYVWPDGSIVIDPFRAIPAVEKGSRWTLVSLGGA